MSSGGRDVVKSDLALLCERFLNKYSRQRPPRDIRMQELERMLGVTRRRLYDVLNVMESMDVIATTGKLRYQWLGIANMVSEATLLEEFRANAEPIKKRSVPQSGLSSGVTNVSHSSMDGQEDEQDDATPAQTSTVTEVSVPSTSLFSLSRRFMRLLVRRHR